MTIAVAKALMDAKEKTDEEVKNELISSMQDWGHRYPNAGYGGRFFYWLFGADEPKPYGSYGNGSAMRVSSAGWLYNTPEETRKHARISADVTHDHHQLKTECRNRLPDDILQVLKQFDEKRNSAG